MQRTYDAQEGFQVSEMAIVDTFTKLIFGEEEDYSGRELLIVQAFRAVDANVLRDTHPEMGAYLRDLGVREMIQLVARVREHMLSSGESWGDAMGCVLSSETIPPGMVGSGSLH